MIAVVIVSYNARADLERCLASLQAHPPREPHRVVVVDNGSTDGSLESAQRWPGVEVIATGANLGFARACNVGIRSGAADHILLLNSDTIVPAGAIDGLVDTQCRHPQAAVVGPRLVDAGGRAELSFGPMLSPLTEFRQRRLTLGLARHDPGITRRVEAMTRLVQWPDWVSGACLLVTRRDAEAVGLLDERYFMYFEDVDFCASIRALGRGVLFTPAVEVVHTRGRSAATAPGATRAARTRSHLAFYEKHHPLLAPWLRVYRRWADRGL